MKYTKFAAALLLAGWLLMPAVLWACPVCSEAVSAANSGSGDEETNDFPTAMNQSIYLMIGVPYATLGILGFMVYRSYNKPLAA